MSSCLQRRICSTSRLLSQLSCCSLLLQTSRSSQLLSVVQVLLLQCISRLLCKL